MVGPLPINELGQISIHGLLGRIEGCRMAVEAVSDGVLVRETAQTKLSIGADLA